MQAFALSQPIVTDVIAQPEGNGLQWATRQWRSIHYHREELPTPWNRACEEHSPSRAAKRGTQQPWRHIRFRAKGISTRTYSHGACITGERGVGRARHFG